MMICGLQKQTSANSLVVFRFKKLSDAKRAMPHCGQVFLPLHKKLHFMCTLFFLFLPCFVFIFHSWSKDFFCFCLVFPLFFFFFFAAVLFWNLQYHFFLSSFSIFQPQKRDNQLMSIDRVQDLLFSCYSSFPFSSQDQDPSWITIMNFLNLKLLAFVSSNKMLRYYRSRYLHYFCPFSSNKLIFHVTKTEQNSICLRTANSPEKFLAMDLLLQCCDVTHGCFDVTRTCTLWRVLASFAAKTGRISLCRHKAC